MNIYLDIDGVLVTVYQEPVIGVKEFLEYVTKKYTCFWLTSYCKEGNNERALEILSKVYGDDILNLAKKIQAVSWLTYKTDAIDFSQDFRWLDDYALFYEETVLKRQKIFEKLIMVDISKNPHQLQELIQTL